MDRPHPSPRWGANHKEKIMGKKSIPTELRDWVIARDNARCRACGCADRDHLQADHAIPESLGGATSIDNLVTLCGSCNNAKGDTIITGLPILPPIEGFGDAATVYAARESFKATIQDAKRRMHTTAVETVRAMRSRGVDGQIIRDALPRLVASRNATRVLIDAFRDNLEEMRAIMSE